MYENDKPLYYMLYKRVNLTLYDLAWFMYFKRWMSKRESILFLIQILSEKLAYYITLRFSYGIISK